MGIMAEPEAILKYLTTDNNCTVDAMKVEAEKLEKCSNKFLEDEKNETDAETCVRLNALTKECVSNKDVDCFSERENNFKEDLITDAMKSAQDIMKMKETKELMVENSEFREVEKYINCTLESGCSQITLNLFMTILLLLLNKTFETK